MKITKEEYLALSNDNTTISKFDTIIDKIDERFDTIMHDICRNVDWYDYDNGNSRDEINGRFEPDAYGVNDYIGFDGDYSMPEPYRSDGIPIRWLWEDYREEFDREVEKSKRKTNLDKLSKKQKREDLKRRKAEMKLVIEVKLTKEELKYIKFK